MIKCLFQKELKLNLQVQSVLYGKKNPLELNRFNFEPKSRRAWNEIIVLASQVSKVSAYPRLQQITQRENSLKTIQQSPS